MRGCGSIRYAHERLTVRIPTFIIFEAEGLGWLWSFEGRLGISGTAKSHDDAVMKAREAALRHCMTEVVE